MKKEPSAANSGNISFNGVPEAKAAPTGLNLGLVREKAKTQLFDPSIGGTPPPPRIPGNAESNERLPGDIAG